MRRLVVALGLVVLFAGFTAGAGSASAARNKKLVEGTVYDATCAAACVPECPPPPPCGPVTKAAKAAVICAQRARPEIVCPLYDGSPRICLPSSNCGGYPTYSGEGAIVKVRKRGSATVLATLPVVEGHFSIRLGAGEYVFHPYLGDEPCWSGEPVIQQVTPGLRSPVPATVYVSNSCVAHPAAATTAK